MTDRGRHIHALPNGYRLHWYEVDNILGQGGSGITYLAHDVNLNQRVAIKEYLPTDLTVRTEDFRVEPVSDDHEADYKWGLSRFIREAQTLARFKHANIVAVNAVFQENNSAYLVMEYVEGEVFEDAVRARKLKKEDRLLEILHALLDGLEVIHGAGYIHRDIKPDNIYLRSDGSPVLLDFGSARQAFGDKNETMTALVSPGYAPYEQYDSSAEVDKQGPWTDLYALAATFYRAVTSRDPLEAIVRMQSNLEGNDRLRPAAEIGKGWYSERFLKGIDAALSFRPGDRPQTVAEWRDLLPPLPGTDEADDSGFDLLLIADEEPSEEEEEEVVFLQAPLVLSEPNDKSVDQVGDKVNSARSISDTADETGEADFSEEETVILLSPLVEPSQSEAVVAGQVVKVVDAAEDEETAILAVPLVADVKAHESTPAAEADEPADVVADIETVILKVALVTESVNVEQVPAQEADEIETVMFDFPLAGSEDIPQAGAPAADAPPSPDQHEIETVIGLQVEPVVEPLSAPVSDNGVAPRSVPSRLRQIAGIAIVTIILAGALWWYAEKHQVSRVALQQLTEEQRVALSAQRKAAKQRALRQEAELAEQKRIKREAERWAEAQRLAERESVHVLAAQRAKDEEAEWLAEQQRLRDEEAVRLVEIERLKLEEATLAQRTDAQRQADAQDEQRQQIDELLALVDKDIENLRLTSPPGNNAVEKLVRVLELEPTNAGVTKSYEKVVAAYVGLSKKAAAAGEYKKATAYLDKAESLYEDSPVLEVARNELALLEESALAASVTETVTQTETGPTVPDPATHRCSPRLLGPRKSEFPRVLAMIYDHPSFKQSPAPKVKWAEYAFSSVINGRATEKSNSRYQIVEVDGISARVKKRHTTAFDNGAGTATFKESASGEHVQVLGGILSPIDRLHALRDTVITRSGVTTATNTDVTTRTSITRVYEISGDLFPLKVGNHLSYKSDQHVVQDGGEAKIQLHSGKPYVFHVEKVISGALVSPKLRCDVFVIDYKFEGPDYRDIGKYYFSEELGLIAKHVGQSVVQTSDGRAVSRSYERKIVNFEYAE